MLLRKDFCVIRIYSDFGCKPMKIKPSAILFDMDGVLVDSLESWRKSLNQAFKAFDHKEISKDEFIKIYWGHDLRDNIEKMRLDPEIGNFCNTIYGEHIDAVNIYTDTKDTLQKLKMYKKAIITNTPRDWTRQILKKFDIETCFSHIITSDDVRKAKPDPEIIFKACERLDVSPKTVLLVGDTESDVKAGNAAGCTVVGIDIDADYTIGKLSELTEIVE